MSDLIENLQKLRENDLSEQVLVPLFKALGWEAEFNGGTKEYGADIIGWRINELKERELMVAQVKKLKLIGAAGGKNSLGVLLNQLMQASQKGLPNNDGTIRIPDKVYFVTPFIVSVQALKSRFEDWPLLKARGITIIDGVKLRDLVEEHLPKIASTLASAKSQIAKAVSRELTNETLLKALELERGRPVETFFTDIDFSLGNPSSQRLFTDFQGTVCSVKISISEADQFIELSKLLQNVFQCRLHQEELNEISSLFISKKKSYQDWNQVYLKKSVKCTETRNQLSKRQTSLNDLNEELKACFYGIVTLRESDILELTAFANRLKQGNDNDLITKYIRDIHLSSETKSLLDNYKSGKHPKLLSLLVRDLNKLVTDGFIYDEIRCAKHKETEQITQLLKETSSKSITRCLNRLIIDLEYSGMINTFHKKRIDRSKIIKQIEKITAEIPALIRASEIAEKVLHKTKNLEPPPLTITILGDCVASALQKQRDRIIAQIKQINNLHVKGELAVLIDACERNFNLIRKLRSNNAVAQATGLSDSNADSVVSLNTRVEVSLLDVLETGRNVTVLGQAGAGKTTALQMYAYELLNKKQNDKLVIFVPLSKIAVSESNKESVVCSILPWQRLEALLVLYIQSLGINWPSDDFGKELRENGGVILFDAIDEGLHKAPWIIEALSKFADHFPKVQVVVSSRVSGDYVDLLPFTNVLILPFTDLQREAFVNKWFANRGEALAPRVILHLRQNSNIAKIVNLPLLTTILCVIAEYGQHLPSTEVRLFDERLTLLVSKHDAIRRVQRVKTAPAHLQLLARKLAFYMHSRRVRSVEYEVALSVANHALINELSVEHIKVALHELADPCNVLFCSRDGRLFQFEHLRYQEHLAARELAANRGIDVEPLLRDRWWTEAFVLFAQMHQDIGALVDHLRFSGKIVEAFDTLVAMGKVNKGIDIDRINEIVRDSKINQSFNENFQQSTPGDSYYYD